MKVFITDRTFNNLVKKIDIDDLSDYISLSEFRNKIFDDAGLYSLFNQLDLKRLLVYKEILINDGKFQGYNFLEPEEDSKQFVYSRGGTFKYHLSFKCEALNRSYIDVFIPEEVKENELEDDFRDWFVELDKENKYINRIRGNSVNKEKIHKEILREYIRSFAKDNGLKGNKFNDKFQFIIEGKVSYIENDYSFDLEVFHEKINHYQRLKECLPIGPVINYLYKHDYLNNRKVDKLKEEVIRLLEKNNIEFGKDFFKNCPIEYVKEILVKHYKYKQEVIKLLKAFFRWTYSFDKIDFKIVDLEKLGLKCCGICAKNQSNFLQFLP
ncbi:hypothetical protein [Tenacibaculum aestuarii]|uniref:hypothetical protein n=1 Tax=Tenacibaculum aestuarii TaxID=362781 RepID=UPI0038935A3A